MLKLKAVVLYVINKCGGNRLFSFIQNIIFCGQSSIMLNMAEESIQDTFCALT